MGLGLHERSHAGDHDRDGNDEGEEDTADVAQGLRALMFELLQLERGDSFEDLERVGGLLDLRLQRASEMSSPSVASVGADSGSSAGPSQSSVSCGKVCRALRACAARRASVRA